MYIKGQESLEKKGDWKVPHYKIVLLFFWSIPTLAYLWYGIFILRVFIQLRESGEKKSPVALALLFPL
jgi:hypothetical protein